MNVASALAMRLDNARCVFPDLTSDDIFRLETTRLWLRWPRASDAPRLAGLCGLVIPAETTATIPNPCPPSEAERFVFQARADNANGKSLVLAITQKRAARELIGLVDAAFSSRGAIELGFLLLPQFRGKGFATEAVSAVVDAVFALANVQDVVAHTRVTDHASRRVLEKCGFTYAGTGLDPVPAEGSAHRYDRFVLTRTDRDRSLTTKAILPMRHQTADAFVAATAGAHLEY